MYAGLDIGSRSMELVCLEGDRVVHADKLPTTFNPLEQARRIMENMERLTGRRPEGLTATGYGRNLAAEALSENGGAPVETVTEIKAYALGAVRLIPGVRAVLDIGGQDTKAIALSETGKVVKFEMNDRCAAGTGKFLEHVANVFQIPVEDFGRYALEGDEALAINAMCTVFAETEATSLMARGKRPENIALGLHASIVKRTANMLRRVGAARPVMFAGGVARNPCVRRLVAEAVGDPLVPDDPDMVGALGAAVHAARKQHTE